MRRPTYLEDIELQLKVHSVCAILGPRQVGKTTLAHMYTDGDPKKARFFDLENPLHLAQLDNPMLALTQPADKLIVLNEIQLRPELFPVLRVLVDDKKVKRKFLVLGSASRDLIRQSPETLAGRVGYVELMPFSFLECDDIRQLWLRGGFPRSFLADSERESVLWRQSFITSFLERDIPSLGFHIPPQQMRRVWMMLVHYHGQIFNASELARSLGVSDQTVRKYVDILAGTFMVRILPPWFENLGKRQVKSPKIYFRDSGILHTLLGISSEEELHLHPKLGSFWEGFALEEIIRQLRATQEQCYFWATQSGAELDLLIIQDGKRLGFEFKYTDTPKATRSMHTVKEDLKLDHLYVIYPWEESFSLAEGITACGLTHFK